MKMKKIILTALTGIISVLSFAQTSYYVATTGNNTNNGSIGTPWQTIQYGVSQLSAGDTLNIMTGTYLGKIDVNISGAINQEITIKNYNNDNVIINGATLPDYEYLLSIENVNYIY